MSPGSPWCLTQRNGHVFAFDRVCNASGEHCIAPGGEGDRISVSLWGALEDPWEDHGKTHWKIGRSLEKHREIIGQPWKKIIGNPWENGDVVEENSDLQDGVAKPQLSGWNWLDQARFTVVICYNHHHT